MSTMQHVLHTLDLKINYIYHQTSLLYCTRTYAFAPFKKANKPKSTNCYMYSKNIAKHKHFKVGKNHRIYEEQKLQRCGYTMYFLNYIS